MCPIDCENSFLILLYFFLNKYNVENDCNDIFIVKMCTHLFNLKPETRFSFTYNIVHRMMIANDMVIYYLCGFSFIMLYLKMS